ncbi:MAG: hypothetical protein Q9214_002365 [Letrouitia sp. 1 TL-2023]
MRWRKENGLAEGFDMLKRSKPVVAVGADGPHPHHSSPEETWRHLFDKPPADTLLTATAAKDAHVDPQAPSALFTPSSSESHLEMLRILDENPPDTITIIAIGPLTTVAMAAAYSPEIFMRARAVLVMGGAIACPGNMTPVAEFNTIADAVAAARIYALSSPDPSSTMPLEQTPDLAHYPSKAILGERRLKIIKFPLDITSPHTLRRDEMEAKVDPLIKKGSPLAEWTKAFLSATFLKQESLHDDQSGGSIGIALHDPMCIWHALTSESQKDQWKISLGQYGRGEDIRVETAGQWTRGMCVVDQRDRRMPNDGEADVPGDMGRWLNPAKGNRIHRCVGTPGYKALATLILDTIFGCVSVSTRF